MTNNDVLKKLRVALKLKNTDIIDILKLADFNITKAQVSALFRKEDHKNDIACQNQLLRKFLNGLIIKYRGKEFYAPDGAAVTVEKGLQVEIFVQRDEQALFGLLRSVKIDRCHTQEQRQVKLITLFELVVGLQSQPA